LGGKTVLAGATGDFYRVLFQKRFIGIFPVESYSFRQTVSTLLLSSFHAFNIIMYIFYDAEKDIDGNFMETFLSYHTKP
jgi:hypothetical protein